MWVDVEQFAGTTLSDGGLGFYSIVYLFAFVFEQFEFESLVFRLVGVIRSLNCFPSPVSFCCVVVEDRFIWPLSRFPFSQLVFFCDLKTLRLMHRRPVIREGSVTLTSTTCRALAPLILNSRRFETTGKHHQYQPGPVAKAVRSVFTALTPERFKLRAARRVQAGLEKVQIMEKEAAWLRKHGSPQRVLGLPDHASLDEIRSRYTDMILDTHPDTAPRPVELEPLDSSGPTDVSASSSGSATKAGALLPQKPPAPLKPSFQLVREAHAMIMNPNSLYHQNGGNNDLLREVQLHTKGELTMRPHVKVAAVSYTMAFLFWVALIVVGFAAMWEKLLEWFDPRFYKKMIAKEKDEAERRARGEEVDTDPKRLAPKRMQQLFRPGRFVHEEASSS